MGGGGVISWAVHSESQVLGRPPVGTWIEGPIEDLDRGPRWGPPVGPDLTSMSHWKKTRGKREANCAELQVLRGAIVHRANTAVYTLGC